jgi:AAA+ ATPase superfamily predicted ATPase
MIDTYDRLWPTTVVPHDELVGREEVVRELLGRLRAGRSVILAGPRRVGKTSVADEALRRLAAVGAVTASLDFFSLTSKRELADSLARQLLARSHGLGARLRELASSFGRAAQRIEPHVTLAETELGVSLRQQDEDTLLRNALQIPQRIAEREHTHVVVLMDEFQEAATNLGRNIYQLMRAAFQRQPDFQQIFVGSQESLLRQLFTKPNAALLRHASEIALSYPPPEAWTPYIRRKFSSAGIRLPRNAIRDLVELTGGHPADTIEFCQQLHLLAIERGASTVNRPLLAAALERTDDSLKSIFDQVWASLGAVSYTRLVARRLAAGLPAYSKKTGGESAPQPIAKALRALRDKGIIDRTGTGRYVFREPLFERYIRRLTSEQV